jgi:hypothetical protein
MRHCYFGPRVLPFILLLAIVVLLSQELISAQTKIVAFPPRQILRRPQ